jgi:hypothetical protein
MNIVHTAAPVLNAVRLKPLIRQVKIIKFAWDILEKRKKYMLLATDALNARREYPVRIRFLSDEDKSPTANIFLESSLVYGFTKFLQI